MGIDGQNARPIPGTTGGLFAEVTGDGKSIIYTSQQTGYEQLARIPIEGGTAVPLGDAFFSTRPSISPDGKQIAFYFRKDPSSAIELGFMPIDGKTPTRAFDVAPSGAYLAVQWTADGRALMHNSGLGDRANVWLQPIDGGKPRMITRFSDQTIFAFDRSADGKSLLIARGTITRDAFLLKGF
jgi:Tol biopolymer transport system component